MSLALHPNVKVVQEDASLKVEADSKSAVAMAGHYAFITEQYSRRCFSRV